MKRRDNWIYTEPDPCKYCDGRGFLYNFFDEEEDCKKCEGKGYMDALDEFDDMYCVVCGGTSCLC